MGIGVWGKSPPCYLYCLSLATQVFPPGETSIHHSGKKNHFLSLIPTFIHKLLLRCGYFFWKPFNPMINSDFHKKQQWLNICASTQNKECFLNKHPFFKKIFVKNVKKWKYVGENWKAVKICARGFRRQFLKWTGVYLICVYNSSFKPKVFKCNLPHSFRTGSDLNPCFNPI